MSFINKIIADFEDEQDEEVEIEEEQDHSDEDDAFLTPSGPLGSKTSVSVNGKHLGTFSSDEEAEDALVAWIIKNKFAPNIWYVSDHGNEGRYDLSKKNQAKIEKAFK